MHYCAFTFRIPVEKVKCLIIVGDVQLERVRHGIETFYPPQNLKKTPKIVIPQSLKKEHGRCDIRVSLNHPDMLYITDFQHLKIFYFCFRGKTKQLLSEQKLTFLED